MKHLRKIILLTGLTLASLMLYKCTAYDIMGLMYAKDQAPRQLKVFVTSIATMGDMKFFNGVLQVSQCPNPGFSNANCVCQQLAMNQGLTSNGSKFNAWLSDSTTDALCNIAGRNGSTVASSCGGYTSTNASYADINGNLLFNSWDDIRAGKTPNRNINTTESNGSPPVQVNGTIVVLTGTTNGGVGGGSTNYCNPTPGDWTLSGQGMAGSIGNTAYWTVDTTLGPPVGTTGCAATYPIYCFEQP